VLEELGLFVGRKKEDNHESTFFQSLNSWVFRQCGGRWDHPTPVTDLCASDLHCDLAVDYLEYIVTSPRIIKFLGLQRYFLRGGIEEVIQPWGWKDPRNTYTFPLWKNVFPQMRAIHIRRHGVDVARSLRRREREHAKQGRGRYERLKKRWGALYWTYQKRSGFGGSERCVRMDGGFSLWSDYMCQARRLKKQHEEIILEVNYEDLLQNPVQTVTQVIEFCNLEMEISKIEMVTERIRPDRAYAFRGDSDMEAFSEQKSEQLKTFGYSARPSVASRTDE
jgi:hypothetical protein